MQATMDNNMFQTFYTRMQDDQSKGGRVFRKVFQTPKWVYSITLTLGFIIVVVPVVLLLLSVLAALIVMGICFYVLNAINQVFRMIGMGVSGKDETGRQNVRVIPRDDEPQP